MAAAIRKFENIVGIRLEQFRSVCEPDKVRFGAALIAMGKCGPCTFAYEANCTFFTLKQL